LARQANSATSYLPHFVISQCSSSNGGSGSGVVVVVVRLSVIECDNKRLEEQLSQLTRTSQQKPLTSLEPTTQQLMTSPVTAITDSKFTTGKRTIPGDEDKDDDDDDDDDGT